MAGAILLGLIAIAGDNRDGWGNGWGDWKEHLSELYCDGWGDCLGLISIDGAIAWAYSQWMGLDGANRDGLIAMAAVMDEVPRGGWGNGYGMGWLMGPKKSIAGLG
jgi:hypothetical protein